MDTCLVGTHHDVCYLALVSESHVDIKRLLLNKQKGS